MLPHWYSDLRSKAAVAVIQQNTDIAVCTVRHDDIRSTIVINIRNLDDDRLRSYFIYRVSRKQLAVTAALGIRMRNS